MTDLLSVHKKKELNIDIGVRCTLQCHDCARTTMLNKGQKVPGKDITLEQFDKISDFFSSTCIHFCGWWSDPIFNPNFIDMLKMCKDKKIDVVVHTAASHKPENWYIKAFEAYPDAVWRFGIDGLPNKSHIYRKNQDGVKLFKIMLLAKSMGLPVEWQYIVFPYNEHTRYKAQRKAQKNNIPILFIETTRNRNMKAILGPKRVTRIKRK